MRKPVRFLLIGALSVAGSLTAKAQAPADASEADSLGIASEPDSLRLVKGFGLARITEPGGKTHQVYVPVGHIGFVGMLPFYRREEEVRAFGQPWSISVDKVQTMRLRGVHYEHIVLNGKRKHLLAARVANGPVELFNYTEATQIVAGGLVAAAVTGAILASTGGEGIVDRRWYVRRGTELVQVLRTGFVEQMSTFFHDDPATATNIINKQVHYPDMLAIVRAYNQHRLAAPEPAK